jgi:hypothetical protein
MGFFPIYAFHEFTFHRFPVSASPSPMVSHHPSLSLVTSAAEDADMAE